MEEEERRWAQSHATLRGCPHLVRHVRQLHINAPVSDTTLLQISHLPFSHLEDVRIARVAVELRDWLSNRECPFDFSPLKVLSLVLGTNVKVAHWPVFRRASCTLEAPSCSSNFIANVARTISRWSKAFSAITCSHRIRKITLRGWGNEEECALLDSALSTLPLRDSPVIEIETSHDYGSLSLSFPLLASRNMSSGFAVQILSTAGSIIALRIQRTTIGLGAISGAGLPANVVKTTVRAHYPPASRGRLFGLIDLYPRYSLKIVIRYTTRALGGSMLNH
ncbi:hypothetical protein C8R43DRAFT_957901 [Mycena crocata]|nr:hypothetical protein C8R43DRAFT_957901 [Mycena crocata]